MRSEAAKAKYKCCIIQLYCFRAHYCLYNKIQAIEYLRHGNHYGRKHTIFRHDNFIGCFSAYKIKMSVRFFCFNIRVYKNMAEEPSCRSYYHEE